MNSDITFLTHRSDRFAACKECGTIEALLNLESAKIFRCVDCRAERVERIIANRKKFAA